MGTRLDARPAVDRSFAQSPSVARAPPPDGRDGRLETVLRVFRLQRRWRFPLVVEEDRLVDEADCCLAAGRNLFDHYECEGEIRAASTRFWGRAMRRSSTAHFSPPLDVRAPPHLQIVLPHATTANLFVEQPTVYTHRPDGAQPPRGASVASAVWTDRAVGLLILSGWSMVVRCAAATGTVR